MIMWIDQKQTNNFINSFYDQNYIVGLADRKFNLRVLIFWCLMINCFLIKIFGEKRKITQWTKRVLTILSSCAQIKLPTVYNFEKSDKTAVSKDSNLLINNYNHKMFTINRFCQGFYVSDMYRFFSIFYRNQEKN